MKTVFAVALLLLTTMLTAQDNKFPLNGTWKPTKAEVAGNALPAQLLETIKLELKDTTYVMTGGPETDKGTCTYDLAAKPPRIKIEGGEGPNKGKTLLAIYELKDDVLTVCYDFEGKEYPKEFKSPEGSKLMLITYKKDK
jgi:uncharacterized protein (TIGR03067 family)